MGTSSSKTLTLCRIVHIMFQWDVGAESYKNLSTFCKPKCKLPGLGR
jgi:hypothetical protein